MRTTFRMIWQAADTNRKLLRTEGSWYTPPAHGGDFAAFLAGVAELVDALDLGSSDESCGGSSPSARTKVHRSLHPMTCPSLSGAGEFLPVKYPGYRRMTS